MIGVTSYRLFSAVQGIAYLLLVASITFRPPAPTTAAGPSVFDRVAATGLWIPFFLAGALTMLYGCTRRRGADQIVMGHSFLLAVILAFAVANGGNSIINASGWIIGSLALALGAGHALAIRLRPDRAA